MDSPGKGCGLVSDADVKLVSSDEKAPNASVRVLATDSTTSLGDPAPRANAGTRSNYSEKERSFDTRRELTDENDFGSKEEEGNVEIVSSKPGHASREKEEFVEGGLRGWATVIGA